MILQRLYSSLTTVQFFAMLEKYCKKFDNMKKFNAKMKQMIY